MKCEEGNTKENILNAAKREFLDKGFLNASLRNIVKEAGVTTGAFYRYYATKEALFNELVREQAEYVLSIFSNTLSDFEELTTFKKNNQMKDISEECMLHILNYIYDNLDNFKLLIKCSEGTSYANFVHKLVEKEVVSTLNYVELLKKEQYEIPYISKDFCHIIASGLFTGVFETVIHNMPKEEAIIYLKQLMEFYSAGWSRILGIEFKNRC